MAKLSSAPLTVANVAPARSALLVWGWSRLAQRSDPVEPVAEQRWLLSWLREHPKARRTIAWLDRKVVGGALLVASLVVVFTTALVVGWLLDTVDTGTGLARWDRAVADWGSEHATERSTWLLDHLTDLGGTGYLVVGFVIVGAIDYWRHRNAWVLPFLTVTLGGVALVNNGLKWLVDRERPDVAHLVNTAGSSFPSGHSAAAACAWFTFALVVARHWPRRWRAVTAGTAAMIAVAVAASRALLGVHWLTDVVAGLFVGWCWFVLCALAFGGRVQRLGASSQVGARGLAEDGAPGGVGLRSLEHHRGHSAVEREEADVVGEVRSVVDDPKLGVGPGAGRAS
jgi:undecaprenyl-diphosphatase